MRDAVGDVTAPLGEAAYVLHPLGYAWPLHAQYASRYAPPGHRVEAIWLGMNPGPWGMGQTGIPFGSPPRVRDFLGIEGRVEPPAQTHPRVPIRGLESSRVEVSGERLWGAIERWFGTPERFFARFYVANYCPLLFLSERGSNVTPNRLPADAMAPVLAASDRHLRALIEALEPQAVIGVGAWAEKRARQVVREAGLGLRVGRILHPSPASPAANRGWAEQAARQLAELGFPVG